MQICGQANAAATPDVNYQFRDIGLTWRGHRLHARPQSSESYQTGNIIFVPNTKLNFKNYLFLIKKSNFAIYWSFVMKTRYILKIISFWSYLKRILKRHYLVSNAIWRSKVSFAIIVRNNCDKNLLLFYCASILTPSADKSIY